MRNINRFLVVFNGIRVLFLRIFVIFLKIIKNSLHIKKWEKNFLNSLFILTHKMWKVFERSTEERQKKLNVVSATDYG